MSATVWNYPYLYIGKVKKLINELHWVLFLLNKVNCNLCVQTEITYTQLINNEFLQ